jgi:hypothetical protein
MRIVCTTSWLLVPARAPGYFPLMPATWEYVIVTRNTGDGAWDTVGNTTGSPSYELAPADAPGERYFFKRPKS